MADLPAVSDLLSASYSTAAWNASDKVNRDEDGNLIGAVAEAQAANRPTAEFGNGVSSALRQISTFFRGTAEPTALSIATTMVLPRFTTAGRPAAGTSGRVIYDTDLDQLFVDDGSSWDAVSLAADGAALSVFGRSANSIGARSDITFGTDGHVLRRSGTTVGTGTLAAGAFATAPGIVTPAMLDNGAARTVLGRSANSSGARADIAGIGAGSVLSDNGTTVEFRSIDPTYISDQTLYSVDFSTLANNTLSNGAESIDGFSWTVANAAAATTFAVENGTGIHFDAAASSTAYTTSSRTATNMSILISTLIPTWDPQRDYIIEAYFSSLTLGTSNNRVLVCLDNQTNASQQRVYGGGRRNNSAAQETYHQERTTIGGTPVTHDCFAIRFSNGQTQVCSGSSSGGNFPSAYTHAETIGTVNGISPAATSSSLVIAFVTGEAGGAMDAVLRRLRVRRVG